MRLDVVWQTVDLRETVGRLLQERGIWENALIVLAVRAEW